MLHFASIQGCLVSCLFLFLVEEAGLDVNSESKAGVTPMVLAALQGNVEVTRYLLDHGGDPAMPDERGSTPLHNAAAAGHCEAVRLLLSKGVNLDPIHYQGTRLHLAAVEDQDQVVMVLLEHGADVSCLFHGYLTGHISLYIGNANAIIFFIWLEDQMVYSWRCIIALGGMLTISI
uniref:Uncharacterized protein n=1 Tax=Aegilops tauschii subsp. strangulata TaxID=200361 RepID=A0A453JRV3_AEGTS